MNFESVRFSCLKTVLVYAAEEAVAHLLVVEDLEWHVSSMMERGLWTLLTLTMSLSTSLLSLRRRSLSAFASSRV